MQMTETWSKAKQAFFPVNPLELLHCYFHWIMAFLKSCNAPHASTRDVADFATLWCFQLLVAEVSMSDWGRQGWKLKSVDFKMGVSQKLGLDRGTIPTLLKDLNVFQLFWELQIISGLSPIFGETSSWCLERRHIENVISFLPFRGLSLHFPNHQSESKIFSKLRTFELPGRFHQTRLWIFEVPKFEANQYLATGRWVGGWPENADLYMYTYLPTYLRTYIHPSNIKSDAYIRTYLMGLDAIPAAIGSA